MYQKRRKCMVWLITAVFLVSMWPAFAFGSDSDNQTGISLDQAIRTVKDHFTIPAAYTDFSSSFNSSDNHHSWSLIWRDSSGQGGYFSAQVDAVTGEIISMNNWKPENGSRTYLPAISINEARDIGTRFLEKLIPQRMASLQPVPGNQMIPLTNYDSASYTLRWERIANNIPVAGDGVNLEINLRNGEITGYNLNWSTLPLPSPAQAISAQQAEQIFVTNEMVKLQYIIPPDYRPLAAKEKQSPLLVYTIAHESGGIIDAIKGTPLIPEPGQWLPNGGISYDQSAKGMEKRSKVASSPLTPEEEKEISQTANLISKEEAVAAVDKYIGIPAGTELQSSNLDRDWQNPDNRIWSLYWSPVSSKPSSSLYARVNARTAEIISFSLDIPVTADQKPDL
ncbi:MAG: YcdB/YcdC domain-containing protein, partial [Syntrophomonadaceae bacterium]